MSAAAGPPPAAPVSARAPGVAALALAGLALRLALVWSGACDGAVLADDAYYYLVIARNLAHGFGSTFDRIAPTNGYHPLWLAVLTPLAALTTGAGASPWLFVHLALSLCALLDVLAGVLLARVLERAGLGAAARWGAALWLLGPVSVLTTMRGMESALAVVLVAGWLLAIQGVAARGRWSLRAGVVPGLLLGLAGLARTDNLPFLGVASLAVALWAVLRRRATPAGAGAFLLVSAAIAVVVMLPWVGWNLSTFGTPFQVSGVVKSLHRGVYGELPSGRVAALGNLLAWIGVPVTFAAGEEFGSPQASPVYAWLILFALVLAVRAGKHPRPASPEWGALAIAGWTYLIAHALTYALVLRSYVVWYAAVPLFLTAALVGGAGVGVVLQHATRGARIGAAVIALALATAGYVRFFEVTHVRPRGPERRLGPVFRRLVREHPAVRTVGAFNAGAPGYFAPFYGPLRVVNLDGLVNNALVGAWRQGRYLRWVRGRVDVLYLDEDKDLAIWMTPQEIDTLRAAYPADPIPRIRGPHRLLAGDVTR